MDLYRLYIGSTAKERRRKDGGNLPLFTYSALADYLPRGNCSNAKTVRAARAYDEKMKNGRRKDEQWTKERRTMNEGKVKMN
ncbi:hypothetical protein RCZ04_22680 [Capnocytophaga sp. HP1101]